MTEWKYWTFRTPNNEKEKHPARITIKSKTGKDISPFSATPCEGEVIFKPDTKFVTTEFSTKITVFQSCENESYLYIRLEEE